MARPNKSPLKLSPEDFRALQRAWYSKLAASGFHDIEDERGQLKSPTEEKRTSPKRVPYNESKKEYQGAIEAFLHHEAFLTVCKRVTAHHMCTMNASDARVVWTMHCQGATERGIARDTGIEQTAVHRLIERMRQWMRVL